MQSVLSTSSLRQYLISSLHESHVYVISTKIVVRSTTKVTYRSLESICNRRRPPRPRQHHRLNRTILRAAASKSRRSVHHNRRTATTAQPIHQLLNPLVAETATSVVIPLCWPCRQWMRLRWVMKTRSRRRWCSRTSTTMYSR